MNLAAIRTEVLNHGFDPGVFSARVNQYINDAAAKIATEVDFYTEEAIYQFPTVAGTDTYAWPSGLAEVRSLFDTDRHIELTYASLRAMDRSSARQGSPIYYAISGPNVRLYPNPDGVYNLEMRYWKMPATLVNDTDIPSLPAQYHRLLWIYAVWQCYEAEDDQQVGQYWEGRWNREYASFKADVKFPTSDGPSQASSMWDPDESLGSSSSWTLYGT